MTVRSAWSIALTGSLVTSVHALDAPILRCASVDAANNVLVTWSAPAGPLGDFLGYELFHSSTAIGPYALVTTIAVAGQVNYLHTPPPPGAGVGPQYYYMRTLFATAPGVSAPSDTVATLFLEVFQSVPLGSANLAWNAPAMSFTAGPLFSVWMEYPAGIWTLLNEVPTTTFGYQHVISICEAFLNFRVGLADQSGCVSFSNIDGDLFNDVTPPTTPVITSVTVDTANGQSTINWAPSPQGDTDGYILVVVTPGGGIIIDTVYGQNTITYTWPFSNAAGGPESFSVAAFDTCEVGVPPSPNTSAVGPAHTTIHAFTDYDPCSGTVDVNWTPYGGWPVSGYQVFVQENGGAWNLLANTGANNFSITQNTVPQRTYCYVVKALQEGGGSTSLSNKACRVTVYPGQAAFNYLRSASVVGPSTIQVIDSVDASAVVAAYRLERSANGAPYTTVATAPGSAGPVVVFNDEDVSPATVGYRYRVVVVDSCGNVGITSNVAGTMVLRATPSLYGNNVLEWNGYGEWAGIVSNYIIHRSVEDQPFAPLGIVPPLPWAYTDDVQAYTGTTGRFCYYVEAIEAGNSSGINATSLSNVSCAVQEELVYIPNAFIIGGANPVFQPVLAFADVSTYELSIINRWGQVIWTTNDPYTPWDGSLSSGQAPIGVYGYYCSFNNGAGRRFEKRGTVTLLTATD